MSAFSLIKEVIYKKVVLLLRKLVSNPLFLLQKLRGLPDIDQLRHQSVDVSDIIAGNLTLNEVNVTIEMQTSSPVREPAERILLNESGQPIVSFFLIFCVTVYLFFFEPIRPSWRPQNRVLIWRT